MGIILNTDTRIGRPVTINGTRLVIAYRGMMPSSTLVAMMYRVREKIIENADEFPRADCIYILVSPGRRDKDGTRFDLEYYTADSAGRFTRTAECVRDSRYSYAVVTRDGEVS